VLYFIVTLQLISVIPALFRLLLHALHLPETRKPSAQEG
jgi:hypothetical protein